MASKVSKQVKRIGRYIWELFKSSILPSIMYFCAGIIILMIVMKDGEDEKIVWDGMKLLWTVVCIVGGAAYNALAAWGSGGTQYEMLVSGNVKRSATDAYGNEYRMSNHKEAKEYRAWKGFVVGAMTAVLPIVFAIVLGCNQEAINASQTEGASNGLGVLLLCGLFLCGWTTVPFYCMNSVGISVSYFWGALIALIPVVVSGAMYIAGAYGRRNKAIRQQELAEKAAAAEAAKQANRRINYGGLPGTKPKKRK